MKRNCDNQILILLTRQGDNPKRNDIPPVKQTEQKTKEYQIMKTAFDINVKSGFALLATLTLSGKLVIINSMTDKNLAACRRSHLVRKLGDELFLLQLGNVNLCRR